MISSFCPGGDCVEVRISSFCHSGGCVGVGVRGDAVLVRDTKTGAELTFTAAEWSAFIAGAKAGEFDLEALA